MENAPQIETSAKKLEETRRTLRLLKRIMLGFRARLDDDLRPMGITTAQLRLLHAIRTEKSASGAQIARDCGITPQTAHALILRAEKKGWIARSADATNERKRIAHLTEAGEKLLQDADLVAKRIEAQMWVDVKRGELKEMNDLLETAANRIAVG